MQTMATQAVHTRALGKIGATDSDGATHLMGQEDSFRPKEDLLDV